MRFTLDILLDFPYLLVLSRNVPRFEASGSWGITFNLFPYILKDRGMNGIVFETILLKGFGMITV